MRSTQVSLVSTNQLVLAIFANYCFRTEKLQSKNHILIHKELG